MRINYFEYFRAITILFIVAGHSYTPWIINTPPEMVFANLIAGGSALFVFMSGFFFHRIYYPKFRLIDFLKKKSKNIFLPYVILFNIGFIIIVVIFNHPNPNIIGKFNGFTNSMDLYLKYFLSGGVLVAYWYIPFIMIIFTISPLFLIYINLSRITQLCIFIILIICSMLIHKPSSDLYQIHLVIYFTPLYMLGIIYSINEKLISDFLKNKSFLLGILTLLTAVIQAIGYNKFGNYHKEAMMSYSGIDFIIIQKVFMIFFFLSVLRKIDNKEIATLKYIASVSFAIYFLHPWVLAIFSYFSVTDYVYFLPDIIIFPIKTVFVVGISLLIAKLVKIILGKRSRYIIGW